MTDAELAILSIVAEGPIYGYDIQTVIAERGLRAWTHIGSSSMYYVLEKLEHQGLLASASGTPGDPARRQYHITTAGFGVLQTAVVDLISTPREYGSGFELGLANLNVLSVEHIRAAFTTYKQELLSRLGQVRERLKKLTAIEAPFNVLAMLEHHLALLEAERDWMTAFIDRWEAQAPAESPPAAPPDRVDVPRMKQVILPHDPDSLHRSPTRPLRTQSASQPADAEEVQSEEPSAAAPSSQTTVINASTPPRMTPIARDGDDERANPKIHEDDTSPPASTTE